MAGQQVGYIRVSTLVQNTERQLDGVHLDETFTEKCSAKDMNRPIWEQCIKHLRKGDTLHVHSLDRVCRSGAGDAVKLVNELIAEGVTIKFHKEGFEFSESMSAVQKGMLAILASVAEMERDLINERRLEGVAIAQAKGKRFGRPSKAVDINRINELKAEGLVMTEIAKRLGVGVATLYRELKKV